MCEREQTAGPRQKAHDREANCMAERGKMCVSENA